MNLPALSELSPYYNRTDLLEKVVQQVIKDFNWFNFEITFNCAKWTKISPKNGKNTYFLTPKMLK